MNETQIRDAYLDLFLTNWDDPSVLDGLKPLRDQAENASLHMWPRSITSMWNHLVPLTARALTRRRINYMEKRYQVFVSSTLPYIEETS